MIAQEVTIESLTLAIADTSPDYCSIVGNIVDNSCCNSDCSAVVEVLACFRLRRFRHCRIHIHNRSRNSDTDSTTEKESIEASVKDLDTAYTR